MSVELTECFGIYEFTEIIIHEGLTDSLIPKLQAGSLDMIVMAAPLHGNGLKKVDLLHEPFVLAIPIDHELASQNDIKAFDLCGGEMVLLKNGHCLSNQAPDICPAKQRNNRNRLHAMTLETLRHMVAAGAGYTLLPSLAVGNTPQLTKLVCYKKLSGKRHYGRNIILAMRQSSHRDADVEHFSQLAVHSLPSFLGD